MTLADIKVSSLGQYYDGVKDYGLDQIGSKFVITREYIGTSYRIIKYETHSWEKSGKSKLDQVAEQVVLKTTKLNTFEDFKKLLIPVPEGKYVHTTDEDMKNTHLTYRSGDIVREVDGASLQQIQTEQKYSRRLYWAIGITLISFLVLGAGYFLARLWLRRRADQG
jgi:hypothetical protein